MEIGAYEQRLVDLHLDPGAIDGKFDGKLTYAVQAIEKILGWQRDGVIDQPFVDALANFQFPQPLVPADKAEADRVEIDLDRQVLTVYKGYQVALDHDDVDRQRQEVLRRRRRLPVRGHAPGPRTCSSGTSTVGAKAASGASTTRGTSTAASRCTATTSVPASPASHGCARIPMHIAEYFGDLVYKDMAVYVLGTPAPPTGGPLGPATPATPKPTPAPTAPPATAPPAPRRRRPRTRRRRLPRRRPHP